MTEVSILILTYNTLWEKLEKTIDSILEQESVSYQIVISDDGSTIDYFDKVEELFKSKNFADYILIKNGKNGGTVKNAISGLSVAKGYYTKLISPGDRLFEKNTLREWLEFIKDEDWSFSEARYCDVANNILHVVTNPQNVSLYINGNNHNKRWNYIAVGDLPLGAAVIGKTKLQLKYCKKLYEAGVKYAEDNMWRLMMFDGIVGIFYPKITICYEHGSGISTSKKNKWRKLLKKDWNSTNKLFIPTDEFQEKLAKAAKCGKMKKCFVKGKLTYKIMRMISPRKSE